MPKKGGKKGRHGHRKKQSPPKQSTQEVPNVPNMGDENAINLGRIKWSETARAQVLITEIPEDDKVLSWKESFQPESAIVNCRNEDSLLLIFSYLSLVDALLLGSTCRRLFYFYRASCHSRKSLVLIRGSQSFAYTLKSELFPDDAQQQKLSKEQFTSRFALSQLRLPKFESSFNQILPFHPQLFSSTLPSLCYLEITTGLLEDSLSNFVRALNNLTLLKTLILYINCFQEFDEKLDQMLETDTLSIDKLKTSLTEEDIDKRILKGFSLDQSTFSPLYSLQLPVLKNLTMAIQSGSLFHTKIYMDNGIRVTPTRKICEIKTASISFSLNCPQLSTLHFSTSDSLTNLCVLIRKDVIPNARLVAGSSDVQVNLSLSKSDIKILHKAKELSKEKKALEYITRLEINCSGISTSISNLLSLLTNLREISFSVDKEDIEVNTTCTRYYSAVLRGLSKLSHLKSLKIVFANDQYEPITSTLAVLPTVTKLTLEYSTSNHTDVVEQLQLVHCFPELTHLICSFNQNYCDSCLYGLANFASALVGQGLVDSSNFRYKFSPGDVEEEAYRRGSKLATKLAKKLMRCGKILVSRLGELTMVKPEDREITFLFKGKETNLRYNPLDNEFFSE